MVALHFDFRATMTILHRSLFSVLSILLMMSAHGQKPALDLQGHRGARGLYPENTLAAFDAAVYYGMTTLELDLHYTVDNQFVVFHDDRFTERNCKLPPDRELPSMELHELTLEQIQSVDVGSLRNPDFPDQTLLPPTAPLSFRELMEAMKVRAEKNPAYQKIRFNIELKVSEASVEQLDFVKVAHEMVAILDEYGVRSRSTIQSFYIPFIAIMENEVGEIQTSALFSPTRFQGLRLKLGLGANSKKIMRQALEAKADIVSPHYLYASKSFIARCHDKGLQVIPWTVNDPKTTLQLFRNGVDGIISDYPNRLAQAYHEWSKS